MKRSSIIRVFSRLNSPLSGPQDQEKVNLIAADKRIREALIVMCMDSTSRIPYKAYNADGTTYFFITCRVDDIIRIARLSPLEVKISGYWPDSDFSFIPSYVMGREMLNSFFHLGVEGPVALWPEWRRCAPGKNCIVD